MSVVSILVCVGFLGFFLIVMPLSIYLFAKLFPDKYPSFIGFPKDPAVKRDTAHLSGADDPEQH